MVLPAANEGYIIQANRGGIKSSTLAELKSALGIGWTYVDAATKNNELNINALPINGTIQTIGKTGSGENFEWGALDILPTNVTSLLMVATFRLNTSVNLISTLLQLRISNPAIGANDLADIKMQQTPVPSGGSVEVGESFITQFNEPMEISFSSLNVGSIAFARLALLAYQ